MHQIYYTFPPMFPKKHYEYFIRKTFLSSFSLSLSLSPSASNEIPDPIHPSRAVHPRNRSEFFSAFPSPSSRSLDGRPSLPPLFSLSHVRPFPHCNCLWRLIDARYKLIDRFATTRSNSIPPPVGGEEEGVAGAEN